MKAMALQWLDWSVIGYAATKVGLAYLLALPIGWEREQQAHSMGLRTFPLVAMAACGYVLLAETSFSSGTADAESRIVQGVVTGIGFVGGGAILKGEDSVKGTTTAASIWGTGAIGASVAMGRYEIAIVLAALTLVTLHLLLPLKARIHKKHGEPEK